MLKVEDKSKCCGCTACASICPHGAIRMVSDALGFNYPVTDHQKCTDCGLCERVCAFVDPKVSEVAPEAVAARNVDESVLMESRSGGVFTALYRLVLSENGVVYGAAFDENLAVIHKRAESERDAESFRGSKYVQSELTDIFAQVKSDLKAGRKVLFSGTPCQVDGLKSYLPDSLKENLLSVDIVCHGVPSPAVFKSYLSYQENRYGGKVSEFDFRDKKTYGWAAHKETFRIAGDLYTDSSYTHLFYKHIMLRPSCGVCPYSSLERASDLTLADFWGWQKSLPDFNEDDKGVSLVLLNTPKGVEAMNDCSEGLDVRKVNIEDCLQPNLVRPSQIHKDAERFAVDFDTKGLGYVLKRYGDKGWRFKLYSSYMKTKLAVKKWLKK